MATLSSLTEQLKKNNEENVIGHDRTQAALGLMNKNFGGFLNMMKAERLDKLEDRRERKTVKPQSAAGKKFSEGYGKGLPFILGLPANLGLILAGLVAAATALVGLRGWEIKALANIDKLGKALRALIPDSIPKAIEQKFIDLRARILKSFGLDPELGKADPDTGKRSLKTPVRTQILNAFDDLRVRIFRAFGLGADGKLITVQGPDGKAKVPAVGRIAKSIEKLLTPVVKFVNGIEKFITGPGADLFKFLGRFGLVATAGTAGKVAGALAGAFRLFGKIFYPLGIIMAAYDGVMAFMEKDGNIFEKFVAGIYGFVGDFVGAPLDLIKNGMTYIMTNLLGFDEESPMMKAIKNFSFEETIKKIPDTVVAAFNFAVDSIAKGIGSAVDFGKVIGEKIRGVFEVILKSIANYFGFEMETTAEKNARLAANKVKQIERTIKNLQIYDSGLTKKDYGRVENAENAYNEAVNRYGADSVSAQKALENVERQKEKLAENIIANRRKAGEIRAAEFQLQEARSEATRLQNIVGQFGDITTNNVSNSQPMILNNGVVFDPNEMVLGNK